MAKAKHHVKHTKKTWMDSHHGMTVFLLLVVLALVGLFFIKKDNNPEPMMPKTQQYVIPQANVASPAAGMMNKVPAVKNQRY